jgi:hypothetical protein
MRVEGPCGACRDIQKSTAAQRRVARPVRPPAQSAVRPFRRVRPLPGLHFFPQGTSITTKRTASGACLPPFPRGACLPLGFWVLWRIPSLQEKSVVSPVLILMINMGSCSSSTAKPAATPSTLDVPQLQEQPGETSVYGSHIPHLSLVTPV